MSLFSLSKRFFTKETGGNVAILFGIMIFPLMIASGMAIDYGRAVDAKTGVQSAVDSAALAAASIKTASDDERIARGNAVADLNLKQLGINDHVSIEIRILEDRIVASATGSLPTALMRLAGYGGIPLTAEAEVPLTSIGNAEIVLVLDYSGSMNGKGKYQAMRDAAIDLVNKLTRNGKISDRVKFGLVPFSHHVYLTLPGEFVAGEDAGTSWTNCTFDRKYPHNVTDSVPLSSDPDTLWGMHRSNNYGRRAGYGACRNYPRRNLVVQPLTYDSEAVIDQLEAMTPHSLTHIALGLEIGWAVISPTAPFTEGVAYSDEETKKFIVVLTDGAQTQAAWGSGLRRSVPNGEENLEEMCTNVKDEGVTLITIAFDLNSRATEERLKNCASGADYFFDAEDNNDLVAAFDNIANSLVKTVYLRK